MSSPLLDPVSTSRQARPCSLRNGFSVGLATIAAKVWQRRSWDTFYSLPYGARPKHRAPVWQPSGAASLAPLISAVATHPVSTAGQGAEQRLHSMSKCVPRL